jgi:hypothetical protein
MINSGANCLFSLSQQTHFRVHLCCNKCEEKAREEAGEVPGEHFISKNPNSHEFRTKMAFPKFLFYTALASPVQQKLMKKLLQRSSCCWGYGFSFPSRPISVVLGRVVFQIFFWTCMNSGIFSHTQLVHVCQGLCL